MSICTVGAINKVVATLDKLHKDCNIEFVNKEIATLKFRALFVSVLTAYVIGRPDRRELVTQIQVELDNDSYSVPNEMVSEISKEVEKKFMEEFAEHIAESRGTSNHELLPEDVTDLMQNMEYLTLSKEKFSKIKAYVNAVENLVEAIEGLNQYALDYFHDAGLQQQVSELTKSLNKQLEASIGHYCKNGYDKQYATHTHNLLESIQQNKIFPSHPDLQMRLNVIINKLIGLLWPFPLFREEQAGPSSPSFFKLKQDIVSNIKESTENLLLASRSL